MPGVALYGLPLTVTVTSVTVSPFCGVTLTTTGTVVWSASALLTMSSPATVMVMSLAPVVGLKVLLGAFTLPVPTLPALSLAPMVLSLGTLSAGMVKTPLASETMGLSLASLMGLPFLSVISVLGSVVPVTELSSWRVPLTVGATVSTV